MPPVTRMRIIGRNNILRVLAFVTVIVTFAIVIFQTSPAFGLIQPGGDPQNGSGGAYSYYGWGWYNYPSDNSIVPSGFRNSSYSWSSTTASCRSIGSDRVMAFTVMKPPRGTDVTRGVIYSYPSSWDRFSAYNGDAGGGWVPTSTAYDLYINNTTPTERIGYTWGSNVGVFCYNSHPNDWSPSVTSGVSNSAPQVGETVTFTHTITNLGPNPTDKVVSGTTNSNNSGLSNLSSVAFLGAGTSKNGSVSKTTTHKVTQDDVGIGSICQSLTTSTGGYGPNVPGITSVAACFSVPYNWSILTTSSADRTTAAPGETIKWTHSVKNNGPTKTNINTKVNYFHQDSGWLGIGTGDSGTVSGQYIVNQQIATFNSYYTVKQSDVNNNLCRATSANPASVSNSGNTTSPAFCVFVPFKYGVTPIITLDHSGAVDAGSSMTATAKITNSGPTTSKPSKWELTRIVVQPSKSVPNITGGLSAADPCGTYFKSASASCQNIAKGPGSTTFNVGDNPLGDYPTEIEDLAIGTQICYALSVQPATNSDNSWNHSAPVCVTISKKPKIQILGGDLWVGVPFSGSAAVAKVSTGTVTKKGFTFGSWIEYGIFATDVIKGAGSGAAFAGQGQQNSTVCSSSVLSFTNADDSQCSDTKPIGSYATTKIMPDVVASFPSSAAIGNLKSGDLTTGTLKSGIYTTSGALTISGGNISKGQWVVLSAPDADITIDGDIKYTNEVLNSATDIPQLIIIAKNIYITDKVKQIDAWLIAKGDPSGPDGTINTCSSVALSDNLTINLCNQQLVVNGPVMANKLYLRRTFGSDPCIGSDCSPSSIPSEIFNLRPDAFLWATARSVVSGRLQTVYTTELPPRL